MPAVFPIHRSEARSILTKTSGFIAEAGFTHSLTPARNCTFGCQYCYVPTMRLYGGLRREDWERWGQFTTFKSNAAELLRRELRPEQVIYCSPLTDPYQPVEESGQLMPPILRELAHAPPRRFVIQTRGSLILRDLDLLRAVPALRVSFSITTNREEIRRRYEPRCAPFEERLDVVRRLNEAGVMTHVALAPILPCDPEELVRRVLEVTPHPLVGDPLHVRSAKPHGATTRATAWAIAQKWGEESWFDPAWQSEIVARMSAAAGGRLLTGPPAFAQLASA